jgi:hypothetical protein
MKPIYKYLIALALGAVLSATVIQKCENRQPTTTTITQIDTVYIDRVDSTGIKPITPKVVANTKPVTLTIPNLETTLATDSVEVNTTLYKGKEVLNNGTIDYEIYADNLVATNFELTTKESVITKTITNNIVLPPLSRLYISAGIESSLGGFSPQAVSVGLMYNRRQKWGAGVELRQDFSGLLPPDKTTTVGVKVYIGL